MKLLYRSIDEQRAHVGSVLHHLYPRFRTGGSIFAEWIQQRLGPGITVLDAGCGRGGILTSFREHIQTLIAVDQDRDAAWSYPLADQRLVADLAHIPLPDQSIDLITSEFVVEHLADPISVFQEFHRVLRPTGRIIVMTPNVHNPIMLLSSVTPHGFHRRLRKNLLNKSEPSFPTYYRANTPAKIRVMASTAGFRVERLALAGNPEYMAVGPILATPAVLFERLLDYPALEWMKMYLVAELARLDQPAGHR